MRIMANRDNAPRGPVRIMKRLLRRWRFPIMESRNKLLLAHSIPALRRAEDSEARRLSGQVALPRARVAVIIATYRRPELLLRAVRSALNQTVTDIVVLVIDDGGGELPELPQDARLQACSLATNTGVAGIVRNIGIRLTASEYVAFLDDDNEWDPAHLETALSVLEDPGLAPAPGLVYTALRRNFPDGRLMDILSTEFERRRLARESYIDTNALVVKRFPGLHFSRIRRAADVYPREDWELVYRLSGRLAVRHVPVPTVRYRVNPDSYFTDWTEVSLD